MMDGPVRNVLSAESRQTIREIAGRRLTGEQHPAIVAGVVGLAVATGESSLIQRVRTIVSDEAAVRAFGITDPVDIARVQRSATEALTTLP